jgi:hypothetical protein
VADRHFDLQQLALVHASLQESEAIVARSYRIPALPSRQYPYEVLTLADLSGPERAPTALAHLVVYERERPAGPEHLYRICLQDDQILTLADEATAADWLRALLIYILTHELVHVVRFQRREEDFLAAEPSRRHEEDRVHQLTLRLLEQAGAPHWERLNRLHGNPVVPAQLVR